MWRSAAKPGRPKDGAIDWAFAEALAFGTLVLEGTPVRLSGQDSGRGTFSQRHLAFYDSETGKRYIPLQHISPDQARFDVYDSSLSEYAVLGFEFGYSVADPLTLVIWEAQFGDFANGAQIMIDQFISSAESKWGQPSGLVMLLPHGFEGQGPEHSSARIERFLTLVRREQHAGGQLHHARRSTSTCCAARCTAGTDRRGVRKPLVDLHAQEPAAPSARRLHAARFHDRRIHGDAGRCRPIAPSVTRVVFCSGKIYYDLLAAREERKADHVALVRVEQLYPFAADQAADILARYPAHRGSGVGAGRAAQHGRRGASCANGCDPLLEPTQPRDALRRPSRKRQPRHRLRQAPPAGAGRDRQRRAHPRRHFGNPPCETGRPPEKIAASGFSHSVERRPARRTDIPYSKSGWQVYSRPADTSGKHGDC